MSPGINRNRSTSIVVVLSISCIMIPHLTPVAEAGQNMDRSDTLRTTSQNQQVRSNKKRCIKYGLLAAGGGLAFAFDRDIRTFSQKSYLHGSTADDFFKGIEHLGGYQLYFYGSALFLGHGLFFRNDKSFRTGGELAAGLIAAQGVTWGFKHAFGRKRPYQTDSPYQFFKGGNSFYSGHAVSAFTAATVISLNYPRQDLGFIGIDRDIPLVPVVAYSLAGMVVAQRLYSNVHWSSDVYVGAVAGYAIGRLTVHFAEKTDIHVFSLTPGGRPGLAVGVRF